MFRLDMFHSVIFYFLFGYSYVLSRFLEGQSPIYQFVGASLQRVPGTVVALMVYGNRLWGSDLGQSRTRFSVGTLGGLRRGDS